MTLQIILGIIAGIGGWELIRYIFDWIKKRKSTSKIDEAEAIAATTTVSDKAIQILNNTVDFQKGRMDDMEKQLNEQGILIKELRKTIDDSYSEISRMKKQIDKVCLRYECVNRVRVSDIETK